MIQKIDKDNLENQVAGGRVCDNSDGHFWESKYYVIDDRTGEYLRGFRSLDGAESYARREGFSDKIVGKSAVEKAQGNFKKLKSSSIW